MQTIKQTRSDGSIDITETKGVHIILPETEAWNEFVENNKDLKTDKIRGIVLHDNGMTIVFNFDKHLYIVNENGKTVQTV